MNVTSEVDTAGVEVTMGSVRRNELPYVVGTMLTKLSADGKEGLQKRMPEVFDRPTAFTERGVFTKRATRDDPEAAVFIPNSDDESGKAAREYMRPSAEGASRRHQKKTEYLLTRMGVLPAGWVTTPGKGATLDGYGNIAGSVYKQIINVLQIRYNAPKPVSQRSQKARGSARGGDTLFFAVTPGPNKLAKGGGWLPPGVWKHLPGRHITQILKFVKKASYRPRLKPIEEVQAVVNAKAQERWDEAAVLIRERFSRRS
jgi:hypothetical protein